MGMLACEVGASRGQTLGPGRLAEKVRTRGFQCLFQLIEFNFTDGDHASVRDPHYR